MPRLYYVNNIPHKLCPRCNTDYEWPEKHFAKDNSTADKLQYLCVNCKSKLFTQWGKDHRPQRYAYNNERVKKQRAIDPEPIRAYHREYEQRDSFKEHRRQYKAKKQQDPSYRQKKAQSQKRRRQNNPLIDNETTMRRNAKKRQTTIEPVNYNTILLRDGRWCYICEQTITLSQKLHFDHVIPLVHGGTHTEDNIRPTHAVCNQRKSHRLLSELTDFDRRGP